MKPFFVTIPHAGEIVPRETPWLDSLSEMVLMCDVDRYVDKLYAPGTKSLGVPTIVTDIHRYAVDANRLPEDIDQDSVKESKNPPGQFTIGFHWSQTTNGAKIMKVPMAMALHKDLTKKYFLPFHKQIERQFEQFKAAGAKEVYHLDAHSMPSRGTAAHKDPGGKRADIVVSDRDGTSCQPWFKDLVIEAYTFAGFKVAYNHPYKGGRITETYGKPKLGQNTVQVEMNRALYMNEFSKQKTPKLFEEAELRIFRAVARIFVRIPHIGSNLKGPQNEVL